MVGLGDSKELHAAQILGFGLRLVLGFLCWHGSEARTHPGGAADAFGSMRNINDDETMVFVCFHRVRPAIRMSLMLGLVHFFKRSVPIHSNIRARTHTRIHHTTHDIPIYQVQPLSFPMPYDWQYPFFVMKC